MNPSSFTFVPLPAPQPVATLSLQTTQTQAIIAQYVKDPDVLGQMQKSFKHFVDSGQVWAMLIGVFIGYGIKSLSHG
jgi:hypothetical protein